MEIYWLPCALFLLHVAEEYKGFPAWATRHFGATSRAYFVYSHLPLIAANAVVCGLATRGSSTAVLLCIAVQWVLFTNGRFHLVTTFLFREYSPGVVTGTLLFFPATWFLLSRTSTPLGLPIALGTVASSLIIASLWLPMDLDWRLRRRR